MIISGQWALSPDGKSIGFSTIFGSAEHVFVLRSDGSDLRQLTNDPDVDHAPSWSVDGKSLFFESQRGGREEFWEIGSDGNGLRQVSRISPRHRWSGGPKAARDGKALYGFNMSGTYLLPFDSNGSIARADPLPDLPDPTKRFLYQ